MFIRNLPVIILLIIPAFIFPQSYTRELNPFTVSGNSGVIKDVFSGGINNLEYQFVDIDGDGDLDLPFMNGDGTYGWYKNSGTPPQPDLRLMPDSIPGLRFSNWFYFVDIDNDGDYDIITGGMDNTLELRRNTGSGTNPFFTLEIDTLRDAAGTPIYSEFGSNALFADIDNDGDMDFFSGNTVGTITHYENTGTAENFSFHFVTNQWQDIIIISGGGRPFNTEHHGASSLDFVDIDADGDLDLFWGDFFSRSIYFIKNNGTAAAPQMARTLDYYPPNEDSVYTSGFNMPRFADIDNDGDYDLFVTVLYDPTVPQSLMFYRNEGTAASPDFNKVTENFLYPLDAGTESTPVFTDIDGDGDKDMFIGCAKNPNGTIYYLENTGAANNPSFMLRDTMFSGITGELSIAPSFGDIDGDGDYDLLVGNFNGTFSYYKNNGNRFTPSFAFVEQLKNSSGVVIDIGSYARPYLFDYDNDGDFDLIAGRFNGKLSLYKNTGTPQNFIFEEDTSYFSGIDVGDNSAPALLDLDSNGVYEFITGSRNGNIFYYRNNGSNLVPEWELINTNFLSGSFGAESAPFPVDIDGDTDTDLFVGNIKGGLYFYRNQAITSVNGTDAVKPQQYFIAQNYPNPFNPAVNIQIKNGQRDYFNIIAYNSAGEETAVIYSGLINVGETTIRWKPENLASGLYLILIRTSKTTQTLKAILLK